MSRYTSATEADRQEMLEAIGVDTIDDLFADVPEGRRSLVERDAVPQGGGTRPGDTSRLGRDAVGFGSGHPVGTGEAPRTIDEDSDAEAFALAR